jgi:hypothetical protein
MWPQEVPNNKLQALLTQIYRDTTVRPPRLPAEQVPRQSPLLPKWAVLVLRQKCKPMSLILASRGARICRAQPGHLPPLSLLVLSELRPLPRAHPSGAKALQSQQSYWRYSAGSLARLLATYLLAQPQQVSANRATQADQDAQDNATPAVRAQNLHYDEGVLHSSSSARALTLQEVATATDGGNDLPDAIEIGETSSPTDDPSQPKVFDQFHVTLVGQHYQPVQIVDISARITNKQTPLTGTVLLRSPQGASPEESIGFDLDSDRLSARTTEKDTSTPVLTDQNYFDDKQVTLQRDEALTFKVSALTAHCRCEFVLDVKTADGEVVTIDNGGIPWKISAFAPTYDAAYTYDMSTNQLVSCGWPEDCQRY